MISRPLTATQKIEVASVSYGDFEALKKLIPEGEGKMEREERPSQIHCEHDFELMGDICSKCGLFMAQVL